MIRILLKYLLKVHLVCSLLHSWLTKKTIDSVWETDSLGDEIIVIFSDSVEIRLRGEYGMFWRKWNFIFGSSIVGPFSQLTVCGHCESES